MKITLAALMMITLTQALASERPNVYPSSYSTLGPSRLESAVCSNAYLIKQPIEVINSKRQNKCADFTYFSPEHKACEDRVLKELGTLTVGVTLEMSANPTDEKAEDDFLKETLKLEIKNKKKLLYQRTAIGVFFSSGSDLEGNTIRFEDVYEEYTPVIDTYLMTGKYDRTSLTALLEEEGNYYFSDCQFKWESIPEEGEY